MRRILSTVAATVTAIVLLFSYHTSTNSGASQASIVHAASPSGGGTASGATASGSTYTGAEAMTRWGVVQVEITVEDGKVTASRTVQVPSGNQRDAEINDYAVPLLNDEVLAAQSAGIDTVSGATVTSDGYVQSLQSALDAAHLG